LKKDNTQMPIALNLALILGSTREGRLCDKVAGWAAEDINRVPGLSLDVIDPAALELPSRHEAEASDAVRSLRRRLARADAFVVVTPEYNHGYPAALKFLIDSVRDEWQAKPIGFVSYGGVSGGLRAVEQLRLVFAELHAVTIRDGVSIAEAWGYVGQAGEWMAPDRAKTAITVMISQLRWWAVALRNARQAVDYGTLAA
jgi:NAD(P)H-dependent FMN reductase